MAERQALVVRGGWDGHQPVEATELFIPFLEDNGFDVRVEESPEVYADADVMAGADLIVQCVTMSHDRARASCAGLRAAVEAGTGLAGWHGGIADSYRNSSDYLHLIGGQFATPPGQGPATSAPASRRTTTCPYTVAHAARGRRAPDHRGHRRTSTWSPSSTGCSPTTTSTCSPPPRSRSGRGTPGTGRSPRRPSGPGSGARAASSSPPRATASTSLEDPNVRTIIERGMLWASR